MKFISWNVNGLRAIVKKNFAEAFHAFDADFVCLQETKLQEGQIDLNFEGYHSFWNYADKKGYSGTCIYTRYEPLSVHLGIGIDEHDHEGRVLTLEYPDFYLVNVYVPNSQGELRRLPYRMSFEDAFRAYLNARAQVRPVIVCGDLNVAHQEIDLKNPDSNHFNPGFSDEERGKFSELLDSGFIDTYRHYYPDQTDRYTWWSYRAMARPRNVGWRIDYFCISPELKDRMVAAEIHDDVMGSDHCPVSLELNIDTEHYTPYGKAQQASLAL